MTLLVAAAVAGTLAAGAPCMPPGAPLPAASAEAAGDPGLSLVLNLPAYRLDLWSGPSLVRSYPVAVGARRYRTPLGRFHVSSVEFNPWWYPPASPWARDERVTPPGPANPMGRAKLNFQGLYYLHGTPQSASLGSAASHGCVRMDNGDVLDLARRVMAFGRPDVPVGTLDSLEADRRRTRRYVLRDSVPLRIEYRTAEVREGALELHPDVYGRERLPARHRAVEALRLAGLDTARVDRVLLDSAVRAGRREHVRLPLHRLFGADAPRPAASPWVTLRRPPPRPVRRRGRGARRACRRGGARPRRRG